jgi:photosystem II stability/assembly factor-like uncharacterized protein
MIFMKRKSFMAALCVVILIGIFFWLHSTSRQKIESTAKISGAFKALDFWAAQRAYPHKVMPDVGHYQAYQRSQALSKPALAREVCAQPWQSMGPHNIGGRTLALEFNPLNPSTIYAGSASGGLWRSPTAGVGAQAWEYVTTGFPVLSVSAIAIASQDTNTIYIGTGEVYGYQGADIGLNVRTTRGSYGIGILKSTDSGETWAKSLDWTYNQRRGVWAIEIDPSDPDVVWAGTTEGTYKSHDAGTTWTLMDSTLMVMDLVINPETPDEVFIACGGLGSPGGGIYRTRNGGQDWMKLTGGQPTIFSGKIQIAISEFSPNILFASYGIGYWSGAGTALCRSEDGGDTWIIVSARDYSTYQGWYSHGVGMHPDDPDEVICYGIELWKSTAGGIALEQKTQSITVHGTPDPGGPEGPRDYVHVDMHALEYHPHAPDTFYIATDGGVFRSLDRGETFQACNGGYQTTQFYNGFSSSMTDSILAMGGFQDNYSAIYTGSVAWRRVLYGDGCWTAIHSTDADILFGSSQWLGGLYKSTDGGHDWMFLGQPYTGGTACFVTPYILCPSNPEVMYAGVSHIYRSDNGGVSWSRTNNNAELDGNPTLSLAASWYNSDVVYAGTAPTYTRAGLFRTINGGESWTNITGDLPDRYPVDIAVDPLNHNNVYVVFSGFGTSHVFKSSDGGDTWHDIGGSLPDVPTSAVAVDPWYSDHIYVGNDLGVYVSMNRGGSWIALQEGLPDAIIAMDLSISPANRKLRVATHGNGAYEMPLLDPTDVEDEQQVVPTDFQLLQNYPNPFNATTNISFRTSRAGMAHLAVYNVVGQLVQTLVDEYREAGLQTVNWDAHGIASGVYLYRLTVGEHSQARKCVIVR